MPKMKTNRGAAKRFKRASGGGFRCRRAYRNHILTKKSPKRKRKLRSAAVLHKADTLSVSRLLPYA